MRCWLLISMIIWISVDTKAQTNLGVKIGSNITSIRYTEVIGHSTIEMETKIGYIGGLTFQHISTKNFGLQMELNYIQKGWKTKFDTLFNTQYERDIAYLDLPFLTHAYFGMNNIKLIIQLGFYIGYALSSSESFYDGQNVRKEEYIYLPERDNRIEYGIQGGIGFKRIFQFGVIQLEGNYTFTLSSVYKWGYITNDPDFLQYFDIPEEAQNTGIQITLSYLFTIQDKNSK